MITQMYLHKEQLLDVLKFMDAFPEKVTVELTSDSSSGIGTVLKAHLNDVRLHGMMLTVTKNISDENNW